MSTTKRIAKRLLAVVLTVMMLMSVVSLGITSASAAEVELAPTGATISGGTTFYLKPNSNWTQASARFAIYLCNGSSTATWVNMTQVPGDSTVYQATVPAGQSHANVIFCRMNPSSTTNGWTSNTQLWNQTNDLTWDGSKNLYTVADGAWSKGNGTWSAYTPPALPEAGDTSTFALMGTLPGTDWASGISMIYTTNTDVVSTTLKDVPAGNYELKIKNGSAWYGASALGTTITPAAGGTLGGTDNVTLAAAGGEYTFNYTISTGKLAIVYTAPNVEVPANLSTATAEVVGATAGTGTKDDPYIVTADAAVNLTIAATAADSAAGFAYTIGDAAGTKMVVTAGTWTALDTTQTAPAAGEEKDITVYVWAYNEKSGTREFSAEPKTVTVTLKGAAASSDDEIVPVFTLDWAEVDGLYAYAGDPDDIAEGTIPDAEAWQRWLTKSGVRHFYLPASADAEKVLIYSSYTGAVMINGVTISGGGYAVVPYVAGTTYTCSGATDQSAVFLNTDAEGSLFINTDKANGSVVNDDGSVTTDLSELTGQIWYDYITANTKNREAKKLGGAVASADGVVVEQVKKIKGRGNTTWSETKKPFNITFDGAVGVAGMEAGKKWSLLANAKDDSLMRNRLVYDMANEVGMKYACDSRFVDFFVDGRYMGSYQLTQKIEMGKGTVMPDLEEPNVDEADGVVPTADFDFVLELDTASNAANAGDLTFTTSRGQVMTHKIPDEPTTEQIDFMKSKYQAVENALYGDDLVSLAKLVDMEDLAKAYLINEISKNVDAGITSCYFVYNADDGIFYLSPVWDYDNALGNMGDTTRQDINGNNLALSKPSDWYASELKHYDSSFTGKHSVFSMACYTKTKTADGKTFAQIVDEVWAADFADLIDILEGTKTDNEGRLDSIDNYKSKLEKSGQWNYEPSWKASSGWTLKQNWTSNHGSLTMYDYNATENKIYSNVQSYDANDAQDMNQYAGDWLVSRLNWITAQYADADDGIDIPDTPDGYITVYFQNNWLWTDVSAHVWDSTVEGFVEKEWPGTAMTYVANDGTYDIYSISIPADASVVFNGIKDDGSSRNQSPDITDPVDGRCYYMNWEEGTGNTVGYEKIEVMLPDLFPDDPVITTYTITWPTENGNFKFNNLPETATKDTVVKFQAEGLGGWTVAGVVINMGGNAYELVADENGDYSFTITGDAELFAVTIDNGGSDVEPDEYNVTWYVSAGATATIDEVVKAGETLTFVVEAEEGYVIDHVIANMVELTANEDGSYTIEDVREDIEILIYASEDTSDDTEVVVPEDTYTVLFLDYNGALLGAQYNVEKGAAATAPDDPTRAGYIFKGWDIDFSNVTENLVVTATYEKKPTPPAPTTGSIKIDVVGGTGFTISFDEGVARPQGSTYYNAKAPVGADVEITAIDTGAEFLGWVNPANGQVVSTKLNYEFSASGNDSFKAIFANDIEGINMVMFYNDKAGQFWDMQYYAAGDEINYPDALPHYGFEFTGWDHTDADIQAKLTAGENVKVLATWKKAEVYINVIAVGGTVVTQPEANGKYYATRAVEVTANKAESGKKFAYWVDESGVVRSYETSYKFYPVVDTTMTAVFVAEDETIEYQVLVSVDSCDISGQYGDFKYSWYVPEEQNGLKYKTSGIVAVNKDNYNEDTFVYGTSEPDIVFVRHPKEDALTASNSAGWTGPVLSGQTWLAKAFVLYEDANGDDHLVYSDVFEVTKD